MYGKVFRATNENSSLNTFIDCIAEQMFDLKVETHPKSDLRYKRNENNQTHPKHKQVARNLASSVLGLRVAYLAWSDTNRSPFFPRRPPHPFVNLTNDHFFYLNYAQTWCYQNFQHVIEKYLNYTYQYPFDYYHVIVPLMNDPQFAAIFRCEEGKHKMSPNKKCRRPLS